MTGQPPCKYAQAAAIVRAQVADGTRRPRQPTPSGAQLARLTGFSVLTCRNGLKALIAEGILTRSPSPAARPRVAASGGLGAQDAVGGLPRALADRRRANGLTQRGLSALAGYSVTTIGHAKTGRLWRSRDFWEKADFAPDTGDLTRLYDAYRANAIGPAGQGTGRAGHQGRRPAACGPRLPCPALVRRDRRHRRPPGIPGPVTESKGALPSDQND